MSGSKIGPTFAFTNCFARGDSASDDGYRRLPFRVATRLAAVSFEMLYQIAFAVAIGVLVIGGIASLWLFRRWRVLRDRWVGQIEANESPENFAKQHLWYLAIEVVAFGASFIILVAGIHATTRFGSHPGPLGFLGLALTSLIVPLAALGDVCNGVIERISSGSKLKLR
jgi:hypothetical protein